MTTSRTDTPRALGTVLLAVGLAQYLALGDSGGVGYRTAFRRASAEAEGDVCAAGPVIALPDGGCNVHPTIKGHRVLAPAVARAARR